MRLRLSVTPDPLSDTLGGPAATNALAGWSRQFGGQLGTTPGTGDRPTVDPPSQRDSGRHPDSFRGTVATKHGENLTLALDELQQFRIEAVR